jgi:hypothetical protein
MKGSVYTYCVFCRYTNHDSIGSERVGFSTRYYRERRIYMMPLYLTTEDQDYLAVIFVCKDDRTCMHHVILD